MTEYAVWEGLLAAKIAGTEPPPINPNSPAVGFYRSRRKDQPYVPVAIWMDDGTMCCQVDGEDISNADTVTRWPWFAKNPVTWEQYEYYRNNGRWEDADETVHAQATERGIGDNNPPDELTLMKEQIDSAAAGIKVYEKIEDDTTQAKAQSLRSRLLELSGEADKKREAEKKPFLEGGKSVDKKWKPLVDAAKNAADAIRAAMSSWETTKANKAKAERDEAEKKARAASAEAEKAGKPVAIVHVPPPPPAPLNVKGAYGRAAAVKPVKFVSKVTDLDALFVYFKAYGEVEECLLDLARKYVKRYPESTPPPGVEVVDKMDVR